jgi:DNA ligase (NAD+)
MIGTAINKYGKTEKNKKIKEGECIFPFKYQWKTHDDCVDTPKGEICATSVNDKQTLQTYGYCEDKKLNKSINNLEQTINTIQGTPIVTNLITNSPKQKTSSVKSKSKSPTLKSKSPTLKSKSPEPLKIKSITSPKQTLTKIDLSPKNSLKSSTKKKTPKQELKKTFKKNKTLKLKQPMATNTVQSRSFNTINDNTRVITNKNPTKQVTVLKTRYNEDFIDLLGELHKLLLKKGEAMRGRAYQKAQESIINYPEDIKSTDQIKNLKGIGATIIKKLNEYIETGKINALEKERNNPIHIFTEIYGIGPKKAQQLVDDGVQTLEQLKIRQDEVLNDTQKIGLKYYEDILKRIPRDEIEQYKTQFETYFNQVKHPTSTFEIVGSYRRGASNSGDIDVIITDKENDKTILHNFINKLVEQNIVVQKLTDGKTKVLVIAKIDEKPYRRVDFLYSPPSEYAFSTLYFTGSKLFNTVMRQRALDMGYSLNEHGFYKMENKKKGAKLDKEFYTEEEVFDFLDMAYREPKDRIDGRSVKTREPISMNADAKNKTQQSPQEIEQPTEKIDIQLTNLVESSAQGKTPPRQLSPKNISTKKPSPKLKNNKTVKIRKKKLTPEEHIKQFQEIGIDYLKELSQKNLEGMIIKSKEIYFNDPESVIMTDNEYDIVKEYLERKHPKSKVISDVGAAINKKGKVKLPYEMWSMDKIKPTTDALDKWLAKYKEPSDYMISAKLDGVSGMYSTEGDEPKLYTRGNGLEGQNVSHLIPFLNLPTEKGLVVRGEFLISKDNFEQHYKDKNSNARNLVAGLVNKLRVGKDEYNYLDFVAYEVIKPEMNPSQQLQHLVDLNINTVKFEPSKMLTNELLSTKLVSWRENYKYEIDGIIVTHDKMYPRQSKNPEHAFAFKMVLSDQVAEAKVVDIIWSPSKDGYLKPKIRIEPIHLGGVKIEYATAFNASFVETNKLGIGALVQLVRSGDVIPYIMKVSMPAENVKMPNEKYIWNETHVDIMLEDIESNETVRLKKISGFFKDLGVDGLSTGNTKKIINGGHDTIEKILAMKKEDFLKLDGFKETLAEKVYTGIQEKIQSISLVKLMSATNLFGRGLGERKIKPIMDNIPDILTSSDIEQEKIDKVLNVKGMAKKTAIAFVEKIPQFLMFLKQANLEYKLQEAPAPKIDVDKSHPLFEKKIVITGFRNKDLENNILSKGGEISTSVSKNTFIVIAKDPEDESGKVLQAKEKNIPIMSMDGFNAKFFN